MKKSLLLPIVCVAFASTGVVASPEESGIDLAQVPSWSRTDLEFFLHGSMGTEVVPERVLRAFVATYPDLFPAKDLSNFGLLRDASNDLPVGVSRREVPHLGRMSSIGINCAACHIGEIDFGSGARPLRVLGMTSHFDAEVFFGAVIAATFRTSDTTNMKRFLANYLAESDAEGGAKAQAMFAFQLKQQDEKINAAIANDPCGAKDIAPGALHEIAAADVRIDGEMLEGRREIAPLVDSVLKLFHNMRAALHVPDRPSPPAPLNGPGRNDPWRILSYSLLGVVTEPAPVKFGLVWNEDHRTWVHADGNTRSPIVRNLAASLGLGAPLVDHAGVLDCAAVERHTALSEVIRPPRYPLPIERTMADRGAEIYQKNCAACHDGPPSDQRLHSIAEIKTDPNRAEIFTADIAERFNRFFAELKIPGYRPPEKPLRSTQKYWAPDLAGVWARSPYLHNGSVRTMSELLAPPDARAKTFHRGSHTYDAAQMGYTDAGQYLLDTAAPGSASSGHNFGTALSDEAKRDLIEYLKTL